MTTSTLPVIVISGPTASGKTDAALQIAKYYPIEIVNADIGQMYEPCSVGTAKPNWKASEVPHHLFDIIKKPENITVCMYRERVLQTIADIRLRDRIPVLVGGSLFYLKSLFFPPQAPTSTASSVPQMEQTAAIAPSDLWSSLQAIDPARAEKIHPHDHYRLQRALDIWFSTHIKPSQALPHFAPSFSVHFCILRPERENLFERINRRTQDMISPANLDFSWIKEVKRLYGTEWDPFLRKKGLIGYPELLTWIDNGAQHVELPKVIERIQTDTRHYAKRQLCFWASLKTQMEVGYQKSLYVCTIQEEQEWSMSAKQRLLAQFARY